jgi:cobalt-zinc-cadmium efflux system outer membrane protein
MNKILLFMMVSAGAGLSSQAWAETRSVWTLAASMEQAMKVAPELQAATAEIDKQQGRLEQAGAWPNPSISVQIDDKLGIEDASGGYDFTQLTISQPLPINRLQHQRKQIEAELGSVAAQRRDQQLLLEYKVAQRFHALQFAAGKLELAKKRLQRAGTYQNGGGKRKDSDPLVRYLTPLEKMRLDIVLQAARQTMEVAEGEYNEAMASLQALLAIPAETELQLTDLSTVPTPAELAQMETALKNHPALEADEHMLLSTEASVAVAEARRFDDPVLTVFSEKDFLANRRQNSNGFMLSVSLPLWNQGTGSVRAARAAVQQSRSELALKQRELRTNLHKTYLHLGHLIGQAQHYRTKLLEPAQQVFKLTRKGFEAGELNILTLIDANNTYFDAQERYFELLHEGWLELAEVRRSAGISLLTSNSAINSNEVY